LRVRVPLSPLTALRFEAVNLVEAEAKFRCGREASERLVGLCDHVAFEADELLAPTDGIATIRFSITAERHCLALAEEVTRKVREAVFAAGADLEGNVKLQISAQALVEIDGQWHRPGPAVAIA
jgi:hypothetical protein